MKIQVNGEIKSIKTANSKKGTELAKEITYNQICNYSSKLFKVKYASLYIDAIFDKNLIVINSNLMTNIKKYIDVLILYFLYIKNRTINQENYENEVYNFLEYCFA